MNHGPTRTSGRGTDRLFLKRAAAFALVAVLLVLGIDRRSTFGGEARAAEPTLLYVATDGNDAWSGTSPEPNAEKTDGPFATLERARDAIRAMKKQAGLPQGGVTVELRGGRYQRGQTFELAAEDSGTEASPVVYRARQGEEVRLTGGRVVAGFKPVADPAALERLDDAARGDVLQADLKALGVTDFGPVQGGGLELFFRDKPMTVARWPNQGFVHVVDVVGGKPFDVRGRKGDRVGRFVYEGDRPKRWVGEKDPWVHGYWFWDWSDQRHPVASIDTERRTIAVKPPYHGYGYRKGQWYYAFNLLSELDAPGEWYLDRENGTLYFWPPAPIEEGRAVVSVLGTLADVRDASHVVIEGMILEASRGTAVTITGCQQVRVAGCLLRNLGGWAARISGGKECGVVDCDVTETGNGGIALSGGDRKTLTPAAHEAVNNHVHHYSRWNRMYKPAISLQGVGNRAAHNLIHHAPHEAMAFGGNDHVIEFNEIHHVCEESNDAGAIYSGRDWTMRGTVIRYNFLHHIRGFRDRGCVGVYLDDMFCGTAIYGNVFYDVTRAAFIGGGRDCTVENNVFVDCRPSLHIDARAMGWAGYHVDTTMTQRLEAMPYDSPLWQKRYPKLPNILDDEPAAPKGNLVARNASFGGKWDGVHGQARPYVTFQDNWVDQPADQAGFVDAPAMNFQLRDDSPVYRQVPGFQKIPFAKIGLLPCESPFRKGPP
jgi:antitoxin (DNA-binding transcriptional repressor) of toxin-antitoxin stability system